MLCTSLCSVKLKSCIMNASGCYCSTTVQLDELDHNRYSGAVVSKSCTLLPQQGNAQPRLYIDDVCINSMGLPNNGFDYYQIKINKPYILSIYPYHVDELDQLFNTDINMIEVNLSCPNVNGNINFELYLKKINHIKGNKIVGIKLAPIFNIKDFDDISELLLKYNINFITCCNTIPNCLVVDHLTETTVIYPNEGLGGMSFKAVSLANVYQFYKRLKNKIDIVGCGGIKNGQDIFDYLLCGATCVQIGTQLLREGLDVFERLEGELKNIMIKKGYKEIKDFQGKIKVCQAKL